MRLFFALAFSAATLVPAGCVRGDYSLREAPGYGRLPIGEGRDARRSPEPLDISSGAHGTMGVEAGSIDFRTDAWSDIFNKGEYIGARYSTMLGLNWGLSIAVGHIKAPPILDADDLEVYLARCTLEYGSYIGTSLCRWYLGGGAGYTFLDGELDLGPLGIVDDELTTHAVIGFEFRNESIIVTRLEGGHTWLEDSNADHWTSAITISMQF
jgi:hypothetical protein